MPSSGGRGTSRASGWCSAKRRTRSSSSTRSGTRRSPSEWILPVPSRIVLLACEGDTFDATTAVDGGLNPNGGASNINAAAKQAMHDWLDEGGRVFATHFNYTWFENGPADFQGVATWLGYSLGTGTCNNCTINRTFPKGAALYGWLSGVGAISDVGINLTGMANSVSGVTLPTTSRWISDPATGDTKV